MTAPLGSYAGGYHLDDFSERYTNTGAEVTLSFIGPSASRFELLSHVFGEWTFIADPESGQCCYNLMASPRAYADLMSVTIAPITGDVICNGAGFCLWPDTFSVQRLDQSCTPEKYFCDNTPLDPHEYPVFFGDGAGNECAARVDINFRRKYHASWPNWMLPCGQQDDWQPPAIPTGTYIEVKRNPNISAKVLPDQSLKYVPTEEYAYSNDLLAGSPCVTATIAPANVPDANWCDTSVTGDVKVPAEQSPGPLVFAQELEVRWSNVPLADWSLLQQLEGTVNRTVWFGFPPESVLFSNYEIEEQPYFGCVDLYTLVLHFNVLTGLVEGNWTLLVTSEEAMSRGMYKGRVGLWNRIWSEKPMYINDSLGDKTLCTHWLPVRSSLTNCCTTNAQKIHLTACFDDIFTVPVCTPPE